MQALTLRVLLRAVLGATGGDDPERLAAALRRLMAWTTDVRRALVFAFLGPDRLSALPAFRRHRSAVDALLLERIARSRADPHLAGRADTLALLLQATDEDGATLSDAELRDELITLLVAGHETTAAALSWTLCELAHDPVAQERLAGGEPGLATAAVAETLRLHPPVPLGSLRRLRRPLTIAGRVLPAGATVGTCSLLVHRRADVYDDPLTWRVDRFLGRRPPAGAWLPFGGGVRRCVGAAFAQFEAGIVLDELMRSVRLRPGRRTPGPAGRRGIVLVPAHAGPVVALPRLDRVPPPPDRSPACPSA
jgi:cytochrome P450